MDVKTTGTRNNHHWTRYALRGLMAYNALMTLAVTAVVASGVNPLQWHWG